MGEHRLVSRTFSSSDPIAVAEFCSGKPIEAADEVAALRSSLAQALAQVADLRGELAAERSARVAAELNEQRWVALIKRREAQLDVIRRVVR